MLEKHARLCLALALIARRTRLSIVHQETDIPRDALRALYRELHGASAPSGQLPSAGGGAITTRQLQVCASLFALTYRQFRRSQSRSGHNGLPSRPIHAVIRAYDALDALLGADNCLDMTLCWTFARDLRTGAATLQCCPDCQISFLIAREGRFAQGCPLCALYRSAGLSTRALRLLNHRS
jgi:hypothetical protein